MKFFFSLGAILCVAIVVCNAQLPAEMEECARESGVDLKTMKDVKVDGTSTPPMAVKKFARCTYLKADIMKEDGTLTKKFTEGPLAKICKMTADAKDGSDTVLKLMKCFSEHDDSVMETSKKS